MTATTAVTTMTLPKLNPAALRWRVLRGLLPVGALLSRGIATGCHHGFDSGPMLDYVYENRARGVPLLGQLVDRAYLNQVGWKAIRARRVLLGQFLGELIAVRRERGQATRIVDIASGPGRYLLELLAADGRDDVSAICRDLDDAGIERGRALAARLGLERVRFEQGDATDPQDLARIAPRPDLVIASGIYEILTDDEAVRRSLGAVRALLPNDGVLVFTTQIRHPQLELIANVLPNRNGEPWVMGTRPISLVERWARQAGFSNITSVVESHGLFAVSVARA
jgi:SAM-dependent methyltransferase